MVDKAAQEPRYKDDKGSQDNKTATTPSNKLHKQISSQAVAAYIGKEEDEKWLDEFEKKFKNHNDDASVEEGYKLLVENMGIFRWQSAHGFRTGSNQGLEHFKPKYKNIKELSTIYMYHHTKI